MGKLRLYLGILFIRFSNFFYKLARFLCVCILGPDDLIALTRHCYALPAYLKGYAGQNEADFSLDETEKYFANKYLTPGNRILVMGCGGGREAIALAKMGFEVTGVDIVPECVKIARENTLKIHLKADFSCQDMSKLQLPKDKKIDCIMFSALIYSLIPSRRKRIKVLKNLRTYLAPDGKIFLSFLFEKKIDRRHEGLKKLVARITLGNLAYESGDWVEGDGEFKHYFNKDQIESETSSSGFKLEEINLEDPTDSFAVLGTCD